MGRAGGMWRRVGGRLAAERVHQLIDLFQFAQRRPAGVPLTPVKTRSEPDRECLGKIFIRMRLRVPILQMHDITAAEGSWPISSRRSFARGAPETALPLFLPPQVIGVAVGVTGQIGRAH